MMSKLSFKAQIGRRLNYHHLHMEERGIQVAKGPINKAAEFKSKALELK